MIKLKNLNYETTINNLILIYAFSIPISRALTSISIVLLIICWLLQADFKSKFQQIKQNHFIIAIFAFVIYSAFAIMWSDDKLFALEYVKKYYHLLVIPIIFTSLKQEYILKTFSAFILAMFISEVTSYGIFFEIWSKDGVSPSDPSPFMSHSNYSIYLAFTIFILLYKVLNIQDLKWKIFYSIFMLFSTSNLFLNGGRTGQFAFILSLILLGFLNIKNRLIAFISMVLVGAFILISAYNVSPVFKNRFDYFLTDVEKMYNNHDFTNSFSARVGLWLSGIEASKESILFGTGIGDEHINSQEITKKYKIPDIFGSEHTNNYIDYHNAFVQYLVQLGITGLLLFLSIFYFLLKLKIGDKVYSNLLYLFLLLYILQSGLGLTFHIQKSMIFFVLFSSLFLVIKKYELEEDLKNKKFS